MKHLYFITKKIRQIYFKLIKKIDYRSINLNKLNFNLIDQKCTAEYVNKKDLLDYILSFRSDMAIPYPTEERAFPGDPLYLSSGHYKDMLNRYLFAGLYFAKGMNVLDSCSGLGWGTFIVSTYAKKVFAFDNNPEIITFCKKTWGKKNIEWLIGDALDISFFKKNNFDCVLAMETIEHFSKNDAEKYICHLNYSLKKGGFLVGTTPIINTREKVDEHIHLHHYHQNIFSNVELDTFLKKYFSTVKIIRNWMFIAQK